MSAGASRLSPSSGKKTGLYWLSHSAERVLRFRTSLLFGLLPQLRKFIPSRQLGLPDLLSAFCP